MNTEIPSKLSLYDILAMLIPGAFIICWVDVIFCNQKIIDSFTSKWLTGMLFIAVCYLMGIIYCRLMEYLWRYIGKFINNPKRMKKSFDKKVEVMNSKKVFENELFGELKRFKPSVDKEEDGCKIQDIYYEAYAFVAKNTYRKDVHILESQFAFLRNMLPLVFLFIVLIANKTKVEIISHDTCCIIITVLLIIAVFIFVSMCLIQRKIYDIVWEDYEYLRRVKDDK